MPSTRSRTPTEALADILQNISLARRFIAGMSYQEFYADVRTVYAVTRCFEIISEASRKLMQDMKARHPNVPWTDVAGAGNIYRHNYEDVLEQQLWYTLQNGLDGLQTAATEELRRLDKA